MHEIFGGTLLTAGAVMLAGAGIIEAIHGIPGAQQQHEQKVAKAVRDMQARDAAAAAKTEG